jgi:membrane-associated phospholipid phosphatase
VRLGFDDGLYRDMVALARDTTWLNGAVNAWSDYGLLLFLVLAAVGLWRGGSRSRALWVPGAMAVAFAVCSVVKVAFGEQRPCRTLPVGHIVVSCPPLGDYAFPSNHAAIAGAGLAVWALDRRLGIVAAVNAVLIAASRVYIGVHYPHDVAAGLLGGALIAWAGGPPARWALGHLLPRRQADDLDARAAGAGGPAASAGGTDGGEPVAAGSLPPEAREPYRAGEPYGHGEPPGGGVAH